MRRSGLALIGCGYVADAYRQCLTLHDGLRIVGAFDRDPGRLAAYGATWGDPAYASLEAALDDPQVDIVVNLTSVASHVEISLQALAAGKHVYSEKPLAPTYAEAAALAAAARAAGRRLAAAPCNVLSQSAQTLWRALRAGTIGAPRLVYAELDDGMVHKAPWRDWTSRSGKPWPAREEFSNGCTFEHAAYALAPLAAMFGPARRITASAHRLIPDKGIEGLDAAPDFSVGIVEFDGGVIARLSNSVIAPYDHRLRVIGEEGMLEIREPWDYASPVRLTRPSASRLARFAERRLGGLPAARLPLARACPLPRGRDWPAMDFARGVAELAEAVAQDRPCRLDADFAAHLTEATERLQHPERFADPVLRSAFAPIAPMPWGL